VSFYTASNTAQGSFGNLKNTCHESYNAFTLLQKDLLSSLMVMREAAPDASAGLSPMTLAYWNARETNGFVFLFNSKN
jgi:hypothetical protein